VGARAVLLVWLTASVAAQTPQSSSAPVFRGGTTVVPLDVRVLDKQGRPITDLTAADFAVVEDGGPQRITHFERQALAADAAAAEEPLERRTSQTVETAPRTFRVFLIYLGRGDLSGPSRGIDGVIHLVRDLLLPQDRIAILAWNRATDFTADHASALAVLERFKEANRTVERELFDFSRSLAAVYGDHRLPAYIQRDIDAVFQGRDKTPMRSVNAELQASPEFEERLRQTYEPL
jgi:VWFA-related protein